MMTSDLDAGDLICEKCYDSQKCWIPIISERTSRRHRISTIFITPDRWGINPPFFSTPIYQNPKRVVRLL